MMVVAWDSPPPLVAAAAAASHQVDPEHLPTQDSQNHLAPSGDYQRAKTVSPLPQSRKVAALTCPSYIPDTAWTPIDTCHCRWHSISSI